MLKAVITGFFLIWLPAALAASGVGVAKAVQGFKAGKYARSEATIASLGARDLRYASTADNVAGILELAQREGRIDTTRMMKLSASYSRHPAGDALLLPEAAIRH